MNTFKGSVGRSAGFVLLLFGVFACNLLPQMAQTTASVSGKTKGSPNAPLTLVVYSDFQ